MGSSDNAGFGGLECASSSRPIPVYVPRGVCRVWWSMRMRIRELEMSPGLRFMPGTGGGDACLRNDHVCPLASGILP